MESPATAMPESLTAFTDGAWGGLRHHAGVALPMNAWPTLQSAVRGRCYPSGYRAKPFGSGCLDTLAWAPRRRPIAAPNRLGLCYNQIAREIPGTVATASRTGRQRPRARDPIATRRIVDDRFKPDRKSTRLNSSHV